MAAPYSMDLRKRVMKAWDASGDADEIARNLIFLVAAGVLIPFAKARTVDDGGSRGARATPMLDQRHDLSARLTQLPGVERAGEGERGGRASSKAKVRREPVRGFDERDILEQETDHPFSFAVGRVGSVPESWEVRRQSENPRAGVGVSAHALGLSVMVIGLLRVDNVLQRAIPLGF